MIRLLAYHFHCCNCEWSKGYSSIYEPSDYTCNDINIVIIARNRTEAYIKIKELHFADQYEIIKHEIIS